MLGSAAQPPGRVLVVDDSRAVAVSTARILAATYEVIVSHSGADALSLLAAGEQFDVILCDLLMPHLSGFELYDRLGAEMPDLRSRMVFVTGGTLEPEVHAFLDRVPNRCLTKPFKAHELRAVVAGILRR